MRRFLLALILLFPVAAYGQVGPRPSTSTWSGLLSPTANLGLGMGLYTTVFTVGDGTGATNLFSFYDTEPNDAATGSLFYFNMAPSSTLTPLTIQAGNSALFTPNIKLLNAGGQIDFRVSTHNVGGAGRAILSFQGGTGQEWHLYTSVVNFTPSTRAILIQGGNEGGANNRSIEFRSKRTIDAIDKSPGITLANDNVVSSAQANGEYDGNGRIVQVTSGTDELFRVSRLGHHIADQAVTIDLPNDTVTGTTINKLVKLAAGSPSKGIIAETADTTGVVGVCLTSCLTSLDGHIAIAGKVFCSFDGDTTAGHYVQISATVGGACHDAGAGFPAADQILGRVLTSNVGAGIYEMLLQIQR